MLLDCHSILLRYFTSQINPLLGGVPVCVEVTVGTDKIAAVSLQRR